MRYLGTPPRPKTVRKLKLQAALGMSGIAKCAILHTGVVQHPTKRSRTMRTRKNWAGKTNYRLGWGRIRGYVKHVGYTPPKRFSEEQQIIQRLTNHERKYLYTMRVGSQALSEISAERLRAAFDPTGRRFADIQS